MSFTEGLVINNSITIRDRLNLTEFKDIHKHLEGEYTDYTLQLLHYGDLDSGDNNVFNNIASFSSLVKKYRDLYPLNTLLVSSGDNYITGPRLFASESESFQSFYQSKNPNFKGSYGRGDIILQNELGLNVSCIGNHEFDLGTDEFKNIIARDQDDTGKVYWEGAQFPYIAYNANFSNDSNLNGLVAPNGMEASDVKGKITGWVKHTMPDGTRLGLIGAVSPTFNVIATIGGTIINGLDNASINYDTVARELQEGIDEIKAQGINKIILLSHMQNLQIEIELVRRLRNVSIVVGGGSNTRLKNQIHLGFNARNREVSEGPYPIIEESLSGPVPIVNVDADYKYLGRLIVNFNKQGSVILSKLDKSSDAYPTREEGEIGYPTIHQAGYLPPIENVVDVKNKLKEIVEQQDNNVIGRTDVFLEGRREFVRNQETNLGNLFTDACLWYGKTYFQDKPDIAIQNGGGIRSSIGFIDALGKLEKVKGNLSSRKDGEISEMAIKSSLRFNNTLNVATITANELKNALEKSVENWTLSSQAGGFLQISGFSYSFNPSFDSGNKVRSLKINDDIIVRDGTLISEKSYKVIMNSFLSKGGNGLFIIYDKTKEEYSENANVSSLITPNVNITYNTFAPQGTEHDAVVRYLQSTIVGPPYSFEDTPIQEDLRIQNLSKRGDTIIPFAPSDGNIKDAIPYVVYNVDPQDANFEKWAKDNDTTTDAVLDIASWDVSKVTDMSNLFGQGAGETDYKNFNKDISGWVVKNVTNMSKMFFGSENFNIDISGWDVSNVTDMSEMFCNAYYSNADISKWDVKNVTNMSQMFAEAHYFNQDITGWDVSKVTNMFQMFFSAEVFEQNIRVWKVDPTTNVTNMFLYAMAMNFDYESVINSNGTPTSDFFNVVAIQVTNSGSGSYLIDGVPNKELRLKTGVTYAFVVNALGHPFWIKTKPGPGLSDTLLGLLNNGAENRTIHVVFDRPRTLYYACQYHASMGGVIIVQSTDDPTIFTPSSKDDIRRAVGFVLNGDGTLNGDTETLEEFAVRTNATPDAVLDIASWDVSKVTDMGQLFDSDTVEQDADANTYIVQNTQRAPQTYNLNGWDVSNVTNMRGMFGKQGLNGNPSFNMNQWFSTASTKIESMQYMFYGSSQFDDDSIRVWKVNVNTPASDGNSIAYQMFYGTELATTNSTLIIDGTPTSDFFNQGGGTEVSIIDGVLLLSLASTAAYGGNGGSRLLLIEMNDITIMNPVITADSKLPTQITDVTTVSPSDYYMLNHYTDSSYSNPNYDPNENGALNYTYLDLTHEYKQSYTSNDQSVKYVTIDCSNEVTLKNTVNVSITRPGVVSTHYLVPMNFLSKPSYDSASNTTTGGNYDEGTYFDTLIKTLCNNNSGVVDESLISEYGMGYNDAQGSGIGNSVEIDLFEMTPCALATTLHGGILQYTDGAISAIVTDKGGAWCNVHGANGVPNYNYDNKEIDIGTSQQFVSSDSKYIKYTITQNGVNYGTSETTNKYGPSDVFFINTLKNITIENKIIGYASPNMPTIWSQATGSDINEYNKSDGWMQIETTLSQVDNNNNVNNITMTVLSQGFPPECGVENMNYVVSLWSASSNHWLDGKESGEDIVRGWVDYGDDFSPSIDQISRIVTSDVFNSLNDAYKNSDYANVFTGNPDDLKKLNPSICLFGDLSINANLTQKKYGLSMDVKFRSLSDTDFIKVFWSGQYASSYGVHYTSDYNINGFVNNNVLKNVPPVILNGEVNNVKGSGYETNDNYYNAMAQQVWSNTVNNTITYNYSPNPGAYLTASTQVLPTALDDSNSEMPFSILTNQLTYSALGSVINPGNNAPLIGYDTPMLTNFMPADGINYLVLNPRTQFKKVSYIGYTLWDIKDSTDTETYFPQTMTNFLTNVPDATHVILEFGIFGNEKFDTFITRDTLDEWMNDALWSDATQSRDEIRDKIKVIASFGGWFVAQYDDDGTSTSVTANTWPGYYRIAGDSSHPFYKTDDMANAMYALVSSNDGVQVDGIDLDLEGFLASSTNLSTLAPFESHDGNSTITVTSIDDYYNNCVSWISNLTISLKKMHSNMIITHAPQTPYFHSDWGYLYNEVHKVSGDIIDFYNIQYYNQVSGGAVYQSLEDIFMNDDTYNASVIELITAGIPSNNIVVGKPIPSEDYDDPRNNPATEVQGYEALNLYVDGTNDMYSIVESAFQTEQLNQWSSNGGIMVWIWMDHSSAPAQNDDSEFQQYDKEHNQNEQISNYFKVSKVENNKT